MTDHLQIAHGYLRQHIDILDREMDIPKLRETLAHAARHLATARQQDPTAVIQVTEDKVEKTLTVDQLTARALFFEANIENRKNGYLERATTAIQNSLNYAPSAHGYRLIAEILARRRRRPEAMDAINKSLEIDPNDFKTHVILDKLRANPNIGVKPPFYTKGSFFFLIAIPTFVLAPATPIAGYLIGLAVIMCVYAFMIWNSEVQSEITRKYTGDKEPNSL